MTTGSGRKDLDLEKVTSPISLRELHWLPIRQRSKFKMAMTVCKCLHGLAPTYLADDCLAISAIAGKQHLRSAGTGLLSVPRTRTTLGMRSFAVAGPVIWNSLPAALRTTTLSPLTFARHLKAHLFGDRQRARGLFRTRSTNLLIIIIIPANNTSASSCRAASFHCS